MPILHSLESGPHSMLPYAHTTLTREWSPFHAPVCPYCTHFGLVPIPCSRTALTLEWSPFHAPVCPYCTHFGLVPIPCSRTALTLEWSPFHAHVLHSPWSGPHSMLTYCTHLGVVVVVQKSFTVEPHGLVVVLGTRGMLRHLTGYAGGGARGGRRG